MFLDFYQLKEQPFGVTPDPHFLYLSASHREALASLSYGVKMGRGLLALVAPPGMGKTTLLFRFLEHLRGSARTAFLFQTQCDSNGLLRYLMADLGIKASGNDFVTMHEQLNEQLLKEARSGRRFVLVIDEAQNLTESVLETARLLTDFETPREKLLQIVFAGQPQLAEKLQRPELSQLRQRIAILGRLEPLGDSEISNYIEHRLRVAGRNDRELFTPAAIARIALCSNGIPRNINNLCFNAISLGFALRRKQIDADLVGESVSDLDLSSLAAMRAETRQLTVSVTAIPRKPADELMAYTGAEAKPEMISAGKFTPAGDQLAGSEDPIYANVTFDNLRGAFLEGDGTEILMLESLEHAHEREAEILAEIVTYDTTWGANHGMQGANKVGIEDRSMESDSKSKDFERAYEQARCLNSNASDPIDELVEVAAFSGSPDDRAGQLPVDSMKSRSGSTDQWRTSIRHQLLYCGPKHYRLQGLGLFAFAIVPAIFAALLYQQDIKTAAAEVRSRVVTSAANFSCNLRTVRLVPSKPAASPDLVSWRKPVELITEENAAATPSPASGIASLAGHPETTSRDWYPDAASESHATGARSTDLQPISPSTVIAQPHDYLWRICLRYLGSYNARLMSALNPELGHNGRVAAGPWEALPGTIRVSINDSMPAPVPRP